MEILKWVSQCHIASAQRLQRCRPRVDFRRRVGTGGGVMGGPVFLNDAWQDAGWSMEHGDSGAAPPQGVPGVSPGRVMPRKAQPPAGA
jgi:hypothetical protein